MTALETDEALLRGVLDQFSRGLKEEKKHGYSLTFFGSCPVTSLAPAGPPTKEKPSALRSQSPLESSQGQCHDLDPQER